MTKVEIMNTLTRNVSKAKFQLKKHSPEILVVGGIIGIVASGVMACKATLKVHEVVEKAQDDLDAIHNATEAGITDAGEEYSVEDCKKDTAIVYVQTGLQFVKLYGPAVALGALAISSIVASHNIMKKRNVALAAAYAISEKGFKEYRGRLVERFGEELDRELRYNIKAQEVEETVVNEKGKEKKVKKTIEVVDDINTGSVYARFFDDGCIGWEKDPEYNLMYVKRTQDYANDLLQKNGYLFLNDVYDMFGIPRTRAGQSVGWIYDEKNPIGDNFVDFGIYDVNKRASRDFVNGYERTVLLDFNVDGNILEYI